MAPTPLNVLLMVLDDVGIEMLRMYDDTNVYTQEFPYAPTPALDALAAQGVRFRQCRVSPRCSPTRAQLMTGRYAFRTGIGDVVREVREPNFALPLSETILPEVLARAGRDCGCIGKWHLGNSSITGDWKTHPNASGFPHYAGCAFNLDTHPAPEDPGYENWHRVVNGELNVETTYASTRQRQDAQEWLAAAQEPWFLYLPWNAIHGPVNWPPGELHHYGEDPPDNDGQKGEPIAFNTRARAMLEALDTEIGNLLASIPPAVLARTMIFVLGDNGTQNNVLVISESDISEPDDPTPPSTEPYDSSHFKGTVYEGGIHVPLTVTGPLVRGPGRTSDALVDAVDLFATIVRTAGLPVQTAADALRLDGRDFSDTLTGDDLSGPRAFSFSERFDPNGLPPPGEEAKILRRSYMNAAGIKLVRQLGQPDEVYDVFNDPLELENLGQGHPSWAALHGALDDLLAS